MAEGSRRESRGVERGGRRAIFLLLIPPVALMVAGAAILMLWLFPIVERGTDWVLIGQNPIGLWLIVTGAALLALPAVLAIRRRTVRALR